MNLTKIKKALFPSIADFESMPIDEHAELPRRAVPFIWYFVKQLKWPMAGMTVCYATAHVLVALEAFFFGKFVGVLADGITAESFWQNATTIVVLYVFITQILSRFLYQLGHVVEIHFSPLFLMLMRRQLSTYLTKHSYKFFQEDFAGRLAGKVMEMPTTALQVIFDLFEPVMIPLLNCVVALVLFTSFDWRFGLTISIFIVLNLLYLRWRVPILSKCADKSASEIQAMRGRYIDSISNILLTKIFNTQKREDKLFTEVQMRAGNASQMEQWQRVLLWRGQHIIMGVFQTIIIGLCFERYYHGRISIAEVTTILTLGATVAQMFWYLLGTSARFFSQFATIDEALGTIIQDHEIVDVADAKDLVVHKPDVRINSINFAYPGRPVFEGFSLAVPAHQKIGIVGPSGAGKTTLIQLLLRLYDLQGGSIMIDGQDIAKVTQASLRNAMSVIPQMTDLMHRSVLENIKIGKPDATFEEIVEAAKKAHIHESIVLFRDQNGNTGYDATVGERGVKLSGGQRQRIAIARAFLRDAPILILDEATSSLDSESERLIQQSLVKLMEGRTAIVIAHRLSTIAHLDRIVVLQDGRIVEDGKHKDLLASGGLYAHLWSLQSEGFIGNRLG